VLRVMVTAAIWRMVGLGAGLIIEFASVRDGLIIATTYLKDCTVLSTVLHNNRPRDSSFVTVSQWRLICPVISSFP